MPPGNGTATTHSTDGVAIVYDVAADVSGAGPALVFVHGWAGRRGHWDEQRPVFAATNTVVRLDLAGHGASGRDRQQWTVGAFADDVVAVVDAAGLDALVLIGHSLGGSVIPLAAERLGGRVRGLVGVDTWSALGRRPAAADVEASVLLPEMRADFADGARRFADLMCGPTTPPALARRIVDEVTAMPPDIAVAIMDDAIRRGPEDIERALREQPVPKVAISSETFRPKDPAVLASFGIRQRGLPGTGHYLMLERPAEFNALLAEVVAGMIPGR